MPLDDEDLQILLSRTEDELFLEIAHQLNPTGFYVDKREREEKVAAGRKWFADHRLRLAEVICSSPRVAVWRASAEKSPSMIVTALADLVAGLVIGVSPFTVAALIMKYGLDRLCGDPPAGPGS